MANTVVTAVDLPKLHERIAGLFSHIDPDAKIIQASTQGDLWQQLTQQPGDLFVLSASVVSRDEIEKIGMLRHLPNSPWVVIISHQENIEESARFVVAGCAAVLYSGLSEQRLSDSFAGILAARRSLAQKPLAEDKQAVEHSAREAVRAGPSRVRSAALSDFTSANPSMRAFMGTVERVVNADTTLLIQGETGVGKERLAQAIHAASPRANGPFIAINCGGLPESLLESELFGHEKGAFTGATHERHGCFEMAHRGTVFLDEVGEMAVHFQVKLLRVLEERKVRRVGGEKTLDVDVRVVAATNKDLIAEVQAKKFRSDLYYRLSVVTLAIPPLRERPDDLRKLIEKYILHFSSHLSRNVSGVSTSAIEAMMGHAWPGNVRELINVIERAVLLCKGAEITVDDLPANVLGAPAADSAPHTMRVPEDVPAATASSMPAAPVSDANQSPTGVLQAIMQENARLPQEVLDLPLLALREQVVERLEREYITGLLRSTGGRVGETAKIAGIEPRTLYAMMKKYNLRKEDYFPSAT